MATDERAPAKINLTLHVTGRRPDGYHLLDSLVVFAGVGDRVAAAPGQGLSLSVTGPMAAGVPAGPENLILRAAALFGDAPGARLTLEKHLPVASGIGGGSADAAAALRALSRLWDRPLPGLAALTALGADVPVCLRGRPARMSGIGEVLGDPPPLPRGWLVLVNPGIAVSTGAVFAGLGGAFGAPMPDLPAGFADAPALAAWLAAQRNDLEAPARVLAPEIGAVLDALAAEPGVLLARMSGSGATCFGLTGDAATAEATAKRIRAAHPGWWVAAAEMLS